MIKSIHISITSPKVIKKEHFRKFLNPFLLLGRRIGRAWKVRKRENVNFTFRDISGF